ncbi:MAG: glycosyltransferase family 4 protein [Clostridia bacterium]|nr:glycosyltransferase family 4 protein [Clostridia bacterium]
MKIAMIANSSSGLYEFRRELILRLIADGYEVIALTPYDGREEQLKETGIKLINVAVDRRGMNPIHDLFLLNTYRKIIKAEKPDQVVTYTIKPNIYGGAVCRLLKVPYAANITGLGTAFEIQGFLRKIITTMYRYSLKRAKSVFFENSENLQIFLDKTIIRKKQAVLLNGAGVNLEHFSVLQYPENNDETRFLFMGRVMAEKGVNELFEAMRMLKKDGYNCTLDMLGGFDENYEQKIKEAEFEGWLKYRGYQSDVRPFIRKCHCFVLPSYHEGMANTNLECASSGRPVITSNIPGCKEAVIEGVSGLLCEPKTADSLYIAMKQMAEMSIDERRAMGLAGRKRMEDVFDKKKVVEETIMHLV